jgi:hypothetical protein
MHCHIDYTSGLILVHFYYALCGESLRLLYVWYARIEQPTGSLLTSFIVAESEITFFQGSYIVCFTMFCYAVLSYLSFPTRELLGCLVYHWKLEHAIFLH